MMDVMCGLPPDYRIFQSRDGISRGALLSPCKRFRFGLTRAWRRKDGALPRMTVFIGANPSTADHQKDDRTVRRWLHFANAWGCNSFIAVNLCPFISSIPALARAWEEGASPAGSPELNYMAQNKAMLLETCKPERLIVACWGNLLPRGSREAIIKQIKNPIYCFAKTLSGAPMHPMARGKNRIHDDAQPQLWREAIHV